MTSWVRLFLTRNGKTVQEVTAIHNCQSFAGVVHYQFYHQCEPMAGSCSAYAVLLLMNLVPSAPSSRALHKHLLLPPVGKTARFHTRILLECYSPFTKWNYFGRLLQNLCCNYFSNSLIRLGRTGHHWLHTGRTHFKILFFCSLEDQILIRKHDNISFLFHK